MARPLGSKNRTASNAKGAIEQCFEEMGGVANLVTWAKQNETDFYKVIYPKLLPLTVAGDAENPLTILCGLLGEIDGTSAGLPTNQK